MEPQSEKNQVVKHGKYGSIIPRTFSLENHNSQVLPLVKRGLLSRVLKYICKICLHSNYLYGVLKNSKGGGGIIQISQKEELSLIKTKCYLGSSHLAPFLPAPSKKDLSFLRFGLVENMHGHLFEKIFLVCFSPLSPQAEQKEDDEHFANHLQMYVSRTFTKAKKSVICSEYPMSSKFHLSKWKTYLSQFIDKYLNIEEVGYLIHYVEFEM